MSTSHHHGHHHHGHSHGVTADTDMRWLTIALVINAVFMVAEVVIGLIANSIAVLSDAAHMLTDVGAIGMAIVALRLAQRPSAGQFTFGFKRAEILSAQINGALLLVLALLLGFEAVRRIADPPEVEGGLVIAIGLLGAAANGAAAWALTRASRESLNVRGAALHNLADLWASLAAALAGVLIVTTGFLEADGVAALTVCLLMLWGAWGLLRDSGRVLLEAAPPGIEVERIGNAMAGEPGIVEVHDLHVWEVTSGFLALSAHVIVRDGDDCHEQRRLLAEMLRRRFGIEHVTLQMEHDRPDGLLQIDPRG